MIFLVVLLFADIKIRFFIIPKVFKGFFNELLIIVILNKFIRIITQNAYIFKANSFPNICNIFRLT